MNWIEKYIGAVKKHLPQENSKDICEELQSLLEDKVEALAESTNRELDEDEIIELLKGHGHPIQVAASYGDNRGLISASLFPVYIQVLKFIFYGLVIGIGAFSLIGLLAKTEWNIFQWILQLINNVWWNWLTLAGLATIVFYFLDKKYSGDDFLKDWTPRDLPDSTKSWVHIGLGTLVFDILLEAVFAAGINGFLKGPVIPMSDNIDVELFWSEAAANLLPVANLIIAGSFILYAFHLVKPHWTRGKLLANVVLSGAFAVLIVVVMQISPLVVTESAFMADPDSSSGVKPIIDTFLRGTLWVILIVTLIECITSLYRASIFDLPPLEVIETE